MPNTKSTISSVKLAARLALATAALIAAGGSALADPILPAGSTAGLAMGAPLPQGVYFINTATYLERSAKTAGAPVINAGIDLPMIAWSTPYTIFGGRLEVIGTAPLLAVGTSPNSGLGAGTTSWSRDFYNPAGLIGLAWDLGGGWSFANFVGAFAPVNTFTSNFTGLGGNYTTFVESAALAYNRDNWSASANFFYSHSGNNSNFGFRTQPDTAQIDFAITNHINKWEVGLVGYGSADLDLAGPRLVAAVGPGGPIAKQSQFALGGLIGYNFGPVIAQFYATRDIAQTNYSGYDTRVWSRVIVPLWNPEAPAAASRRPLITK